MCHPRSVLCCRVHLSWITVQVPVFGPPIPRYSFQYLSGGTDCRSKDRGPFQGTVFCIPTQEYERRGTITTRTTPELKRIRKISTKLNPFLLCRGRGKRTVGSEVVRVGLRRGRRPVALPPGPWARDGILSSLSEDLNLVLLDKVGPLAGNKCPRRVASSQLFLPPVQTRKGSYVNPFQSLWFLWWTSTSF